MFLSDYRIEPADYNADFNDLRAVREPVFIIEQHIPAEIEQDDADRHSYHVIARDNDHRPIGTGRLTAEGSIGRIAVLANWRNRGVGQSILRTLIERAQKQGLSKIIVDSPLAASVFFHKFGFVGEGGIVEMRGNKVQRMSLHPDPLAKEVRPPAKPSGESIVSQKLENLEAHIDSSIRLITEARRQICLFTVDLEHGLYGNNDVVEAFKQFAINSRDGSVQIIVQDTFSARSKPHPLIDLAQRLPSSFHFRAPMEPEDQQYASALLLNDRDGYLFRLLAERYQGEWSPRHPARKRQLYETFDRMWQRSRPCTEFRALGI